MTKYTSHNFRVIDRQPKPSYLQYVNKQALSVTLRATKQRLLRPSSIGIGVALMLVLYAGTLAAVFAWDAPHTQSLCPGSRDITQIDTEHAKIVQHSTHYSFAYTTSPEMSWAGGRWNMLWDTTGDCLLYSTRVSSWTDNQALGLLPVERHWLAPAVAPQPAVASATFSVTSDPTTQNTPDKMQAALEKQRQLEDLMRPKHAPSVHVTTTITYGRATLDGHPALLSKITALGTGPTVGYYEQVQAVYDDKTYTVGWSVVARNSAERDAFILKHRAELESMVVSFHFH